MISVEYLIAKPHTNPMNINKIRIPQSHTRSRKISDTVRKNIKEYHDSCKSLNATAKAFNVSRITVRTVVDPEYRKKQNEAQKKVNRKEFPSRSPKMRRIEKQREIAYKAQLIKDGIIKPCADCKEEAATLGDYCTNCAQNIPA